MILRAIAVWALGLYAVLVLVGCGEIQAQPQMGQDALAATAPNNKSHHSLILLNDINGLNLYKWPGGKFVKTVTGVAGNGYCNGDHSGEAWVVSGGQQVYQILSDGMLGKIIQDKYQPTWSCAVYSVTHTLAVTGWDTGRVALFANEEGYGTAYKTPLSSALYCTYDADGNLFVDGMNSSAQGAIVELPKGKSSFKAISLNKAIDGFRAIQWDGKALAVEATQGSGEITIYRFRVTGSSGTVIGTTTLRTNYNVESRRGNAEFWIRGNHILEGTNDSSGSKPSYLQFWKYPEGGDPYKTVQVPPNIGALTVAGIGG